jgi:hypothetical protein
MSVVLEYRFVHLVPAPWKWFLLTNKLRELNTHDRRNRRVGVGCCRRLEGVLYQS